MGISIKLRKSDKDILGCLYSNIMNYIVIYFQVRCIFIFKKIDNDKVNLNNIFFFICVILKFDIKFYLLYLLSLVLVIFG